MRVNQALSWFARQKTLIPVRVLDGPKLRSKDKHRCEATRYSRSNVFGKPFPDKDGNENGPEELDTLLLKEHPLATMKGIKELNGRQQIGEYDVSGVYQE